MVVYQRSSPSIGRQVDISYWVITSIYSQHSCGAQNYHFNMSLLNQDEYINGLLLDSGIAIANALNVPHPSFELLILFAKYHIFIWFLDKNISMT